MTLSSSNVSSGKSQRCFLVVFNPTPNRSRKRRLSLLISALKQQGHEWHLYATEEGLAANGAALHTRLNGVTDVIVVGGDGTLNVVLNSLPFDTQTLTVPFSLGLLPAGTGNDFARSWYDRELSDHQIIERLLGTSTHKLALGECEMKHTARLFHNVLGAGFDALIAKQLKNDKSVFRRFSYFWTALKFIPFYQEPFCTYWSPNLPEPTTKRFNNLITTFANAKYFGGGLPIAPTANAQHSSLEVVSVSKLPLHTKLQLLLKLVSGKHMLSPHVYHETLASGQVAEITTEGLELEADGEFIGYSPCKVNTSRYWINMKA